MMVCPFVVYKANRVEPRAGFEPATSASLSVYQGDALTSWATEAFSFSQIYYQGRRILKGFEASVCVLKRFRVRLNFGVSESGQRHS
jgi:hypothetical protein